MYAPVSSYNLAADLYRQQVARPESTKLPWDPAPVRRALTIRLPILTEQAATAMLATRAKVAAAICVQPANIRARRDLFPVKIALQIRRRFIQAPLHRPTASVSVATRSRAAAELAQPACQANTR